METKLQSNFEVGNIALPRIDEPSFKPYSQAASNDQKHMRKNGRIGLYRLSELGELITLQEKLQNIKTPRYS